MIVWCLRYYESELHKWPRNPSSTGIYNLTQKTYLYVYFPHGDNWEFSLAGTFAVTCYEVMLANASINPADCSSVALGILDRSYPKWSKPIKYSLTAYPKPSYDDSMSQIKKKLKANYWIISMTFFPTLSPLLHHRQPYTCFPRINKPMVWHNTGSHAGSGYTNTIIFVAFLYRAKKKATNKTKLDHI